MNYTDVHELHDNPDSFEGPAHDEDAMFLDDEAPEPLKPDFGAIGEPGDPYVHQITRAIEKNFVTQTMRRAQELSQEFNQLMAEAAAAVCHDAEIPFNPDADLAIFRAHPETGSLTLEVTPNGLR